MYEMLAGRPPFGTSDDQPVVHAILYEAPRPLAELRPDVPAELASIIDRCLRKDRAERHRLAVDLYRDLVRCRRNLVRASTAALHQASSTSHAPVPAPAAASPPSPAASSPAADRGVRSCTMWVSRQNHGELRGQVLYSWGSRADAL